MRCSVFEKVLLILLLSYVKYILFRSITSTSKYASLSNTHFFLCDSFGAIAGASTIVCQWLSLVQLFNMAAWVGVIAMTAMGIYDMGPTYGKDYAGLDYNVTMWHSGCSPPPTPAANLYCMSFSLSFTIITNPRIELCPSLLNNWCIHSPDHVWDPSCTPPPFREVRRHAESTTMNPCVLFSLFPSSTP